MCTILISLSKRRYAASSLQCLEVPRDCRIRLPDEVLATFPVFECRVEVLVVRRFCLLGTKVIGVHALRLQHVADRRVGHRPLIGGELAPEAVPGELLPARGDVLDPPEGKHRNAGVEGRRGHLPANWPSSFWCPPTDPAYHSGTGTASASARSALPVRAAGHPMGPNQATCRPTPSSVEGGRARMRSKAGRECTASRRGASCRSRV